MPPTDRLVLPLEGIEDVLALLGLVEGGDDASGLPLGQLVLDQFDAAGPGHAGEGEGEILTGINLVRSDFLLGVVDVELRIAHISRVPGGAGRERTLGLRRDAVGLVLDDRLDVGGQGDSLTGVGVVERLFARVEHDHVLLQLTLGLEDRVDRLVTLEVLDRVGLCGVEDLDVTRLEGALPDRRLDDRLERDRVQVRKALAPIVGVLGGREMVADDPLLEYEGAGTDRLLGGGLAGDRGRLGHDAELAGEVAGERHPGPLHLHQGREVVAGDLGDRVDVGEGCARERGVVVCLERRRHVDVGDRAAVVELDARAELDRPFGERRIRCDRFGQVRVHLAVVAELGQLVVDGLGVGKPCDIPAVACGVEAVDVGLGAHRDIPAVFRHKGRRRAGRCGAAASPERRRGGSGILLAATASGGEHDGCGGDGGDPDEAPRTGRLSCVQGVPLGCVAACGAVTAVTLARSQQETVAGVAKA